MQARTHVHLMLLALFFSSSVHSIAEPLINGLFFKKKKKKIPWNIPFAIGRKAPHVSPATFQKKKKKPKKIPLCVRFVIILWSIVC